MDRNQTLNDPETAMRYALSGLQSQMWTAFPAIVQSVNLAAMTIECVPAIKGVATDSNGVQSFVTMPVLADVPICFPSAGGFSLTLPIAVDDEMLVVIANRCIDAWWQSGGIQAPIELRMHDLSDGFAIPGPRSLPNVVSGISATNAQLRNDAGTVYLEITPTGGINMVAPSGVVVTGDLTVVGELITEAIATTGTLSITGALAVTGNITASGTAVVTGEVTANGITLSTHIHSGVSPGGSNTSGPSG